ncbi:MAG TPA: hypothetical protein VK698_39545 [Kofleriaceae bacterium]|nr:hypothetical protein [Kofleriaceae bacterium]
MTITSAEARDLANAALARLYGNVTQYDRLLLEQAIDSIAGDGSRFSMNELRAVLPEIGYKAAGLFFHGLVAPHKVPLVEIVDEVTSVNKKAHGKTVKVYVLTPHGRVAFSKRRRERAALRDQNARAAA